MCGDGLGDKVEDALRLVGITQERVEKWLGEDCGCEERKERLNQLGRWASRVLSGKLDRAAMYLERFIGG